MEESQKLLSDHVKQRLSCLSVISCAVPALYAKDLRTLRTMYEYASYMLIFGSDYDLVYGWEFRSLVEVADYSFLEVLSEIKYESDISVRSRIIQIEHILEYEYATVKKNEPILN